ncbi:MAG: DUF4126 domain-containing protein [Anaerolineae bacterium]
MDVLLDLASAFGLSTSAGLNAYIPLLTVAVLGRFTPLVKLEAPWNALTNVWIIILLTVLLIIEVFADKIPVVDTINDGIQTFVRPTAGAIMFAATTQSTIDIHPVLAMACGVVLAGSVHAVKAGSRPVLSAATAGVADPVVSTIEDVIAAVTSFLALIFPYLLLIWLILLATLIYLLFRRRIARRRVRS